MIDEDGYLYIMARTDDVINVAGHRLSTGGMEEVLASHPDVAECAVIGVSDDLKGQLPVGLPVPECKDVDQRAMARSWQRECVKLVRDKIGPGRRIQAGHRGGPPAQDPLGQDPARHDGLASLMARTTRCPPRSTIRPFWTKSKRRYRGSATRKA